MATPDPVLTPITRPAPMEYTQAAVHWRTADIGRTQQIMADALAMLAGIWFMHYLFAQASTTPELSYSVLSSIVIAAMITTTFAFAGAYSREPTPVNIGDTEGLVRGICCVIILGLMSCLNRHTLPEPLTIWTAICILYMLLLERELLHAVIGRHHRHLRSAHASSEDPRRSDAMATVQAITSFRGSALAQDNNTEYVSSQSSYPAVLELTGYSRDRRPQVSPGLLLKRTVDLFTSLLLLLLSVPLLLVVAAMIKLESKGPALIRQRRIGKDGVTFRMWKFRSMHACVPQYEHSPKSDDDPRLTTVGRWLRRLSIDEIPQLLNVLKGDMSLVGPRPEMPFIVSRYGPYERGRLRAIPGITGLWQISPARAMPIHENVELDLFYIKRQNIFLDTAILLRTVTAVIRGIGAA